MAGYKRVILCLWARPFAPSKKVILDLVISRENTGILGLGLRNCQSRAGDVDDSRRRPSTLLLAKCSPRIDNPGKSGRQCVNLPEGLYCGGST